MFQIWKQQIYKNGPVLVRQGRFSYEQQNGRVSVRQCLKMVNTARVADLHKAEIGVQHRQVIHGGSVTHIWDSFLPSGGFLVYQYIALNG